MQLRIERKDVGEGDGLCAIVNLVVLWEILSCGLHKRRVIWVCVCADIPMATRW
jgi:hypothetical protein